MRIAIVLLGISIQSGSIWTKCSNRLSITNGMISYSTTATLVVVVDTRKLQQRIHVIFSRPKIPWNWQGEQRLAA